MLSPCFFSYDRTQHSVKTLGHESGLEVFSVLTWTFLPFVLGLVSVLGIGLTKYGLL